MAGAHAWPVSSHLPARGGSRAAAFLVVFGAGFQSPPREGRIRNTNTGTPRQGSFQSPPREGRIYLAGVVESNSNLFPVTSPRGEDPDKDTGEKRMSRFPVTSPRGEDLIALGGRVCQVGFQSPPREGRIVLVREVLHRVQVSSHLPARGGSVKKYRVRADEAVSSHLPARGGSQARANPGPTHVVSSHLPARGGSPPENRRIFLCQVSSHLPARGGSAPRRFFFVPSLFPVTSPRGEDHSDFLNPRMATEFPVTSPRGEDQQDEGRRLRGNAVSSHLPARGGSATLHWVRCQG